MGYGREVYLSAEKTLRERRRAAREEAERRKAAFRGECPQAEELERRLSSTAVRAAKAVLGGESARGRLEKLKEENKAVQAEYARLLAAHGLKPDDLEPRYACPRCKDTGYVDGKMCTCLKGLLRAESFRRLNALTPLSLSTFESFSLGWYSNEPREGRPSDREIMGDTFRFCAAYAEHFSTESPNLILTGGTGLGKTHLSLAIANAAIEKGFGTVYCSVGGLVKKLEDEHFGRGNGEDPSGPLLACDLLILDDLGTEFRSSFSTAAIYAIVNGRLLAQKPTLISTNLSVREMMEFYSERFVSRIIGSYRRVVFVGKDIRQQKRLCRAPK